MNFKKDNLDNIKYLIVKITPVVTIAASLLSMWSGQHSQKRIISEEVRRQMEQLNNR